ncbi:MAG: dienelactone hydrolase family protein [Desulfuromonas sp.]|nr:dienelactone hydrolase family protein [Desulfuromonas sp.]
MRVIMVLVLLAGLLAAGSSSAAVKGSEVDYRASDGTVLKGYLALDDSGVGRRPGVLVVHEWWGHNDYARKRAEMLAGLGYVALAVDMYGNGQQAGHPDDAGKFAGAVRKNLPLMKERFVAAWELLRRQPTVDPGKIAAIGYCFGGGVVLEMARSGLDLKGVASFHGSLEGGSKAQPGQVKARVLVLNGAADKFTTPEQIEAFRKEMETAGVNYKFVDYPGALHSFTNPAANEYAKKFNMPIGYNAEADQASWLELQVFFKEIFG